MKIKITPYHIGMSTRNTMKYFFSLNNWFFGSYDVIMTTKIRVSKGLKGSKIKISAIVSRIFNYNPWNSRFFRFPGFPDIKLVFYILASYFRHCNAYIVLPNVLTIYVVLELFWHAKLIYFVIFLALLSFYIIMPSFIFLAYLWGF